MCGIAGIAGIGAGGDAAVAPVEHVVRRMSHRGPDASGVKAFDGCVLGHARLRIIDLSPLGDQPMTNEDGSVWLVYNGEVYNFTELREDLQRAGHRFRSKTDSEVLVHLYEEHGPGMVNLLRGMFAFAIWDDRRKRLLLARDRLGIKPLYYREHGPALHFASEASAIADPGASIDRTSVARYLQLGWVPGPATIWSGVCELLPGHVLEWSDGRATTSRYWEPAFGEPGQPGGPCDPTDLHEVLIDAFRRHLVADVPVGLFLSAGVDSVSLASLASKLAADVHAFTVAFDDAPDEAAEAGAIARGLGIPHHTVPVRAADALTSLERIVGSLDQPSVDGVNTWVISKAVRDAGIIVALSGLGGDELFAGYSTFRHVPRLARWATPAATLPAWARRRVLGLLEHPATRYSPARRAALAIDAGGYEAAYAAVRGVLSPVDAARLAGVEPDGSVPLGVNGSEHHGVSRLELANYLPYQLLRDSDVMSMAHALELRVPLLDDAVVAIALACGPTAGGLQGKALLAMASGYRDAQQLAKKPKRTFTLPFHQWLQHDIAGLARGAVQRLTDADVGCDAGEVDALWRAWERRQVGWRSIWAPAALGMWVDSHAAGATAG